MYSTKNKYVIKLWNIRPFLNKKYNTWGVGGTVPPTSRANKENQHLLYSTRSSSSHFQPPIAYILYYIKVEKISSTK